ncbi:MAG: hypothetical protein QJR07_21160 [Acetobacteraceae bacterium]|nr:hypothetical protein [Acetobacteraceae bacterium]MDI3309588.1 hypothetical protein [Acetobacteraceae bacterium]
MCHLIAALLLLGLAACAERSGVGVSGPYVGGAVGGNVAQGARIR